MQSQIHAKKDTAAALPGLPGSANSVPASNQVTPGITLIDLAVICIYADALSADIDQNEFRVDS
jgi:hypothetical protein